MSTAEALGLFAVLALIALALVIPLNRPTQVLALIGGVLAVTYPFLKRFFSLPQAYLGAAFGWSVPMAFAAQTGSRAADRLGDVPVGRAAGRRPTTRCTRWSIARTTS